MVMSDLNKKMHALAVLTREKRKLDAQLKATKDKIKQLEEDCIEDWIMADVKPGQIYLDDDDVYTPSLRSQIWAGAETSGQDLARALKAAGLEEFITVNWTSLSSYVREFVERTGQIPSEGAEVAIDVNGVAGIPPEVLPHLKITERYGLSLRRK
jgi:hypothetical protein